MIGNYVSGRFIAACALVAFCGMACTAVAADDTQPTSNNSQPSSLDKQLLDDLGGDLLEDLDPPRADTSKGEGPKKPAEGGQETPKPAEPEEGAEPSSTDEQLLDQLIDGEDIDLSGKSEDPILDLGRRMKDVERMISQRNTSAGTQQMQRQIAADIARLIEQLRQQRQQPSPGSSKSSPNKPQPGQPQPKSGDPESDKPAQDSQDRTGSNQDQPLEIGAMEELLKDVWGHLPERVRRQMLNGSGEQVLPKYQKLIEQYYKRLAEDAENYP